MQIRKATTADIPHMVAIAECKRVEYEGYSPVFWRQAPDASSTQARFFQRLLTGTDVIALVATTASTLLGFLIGVVTTAPPVYHPGGPVCIVDDFAVATPTAWGSVGAALVAALEQEARARGAVLSVMVCAQRDQAKRAMLQEAGLTVASEWYVKPL